MVILAFLFDFATFSNSFVDFHYCSACVNFNFWSFLLVSYFKMHLNIYWVTLRFPSCFSNCERIEMSEMQPAARAASPAPSLPPRGPSFVSLHTQNSGVLHLSSVLTSVSELEQKNVHTWVHTKASSDAQRHPGCNASRAEESTNHKSADFYPVWMSQIRFNILSPQLEGRKRRGVSAQKEKKLVYFLVVLSLGNLCYKNKEEGGKRSFKAIVQKLF